MGSAWAASSRSWKTLWRQLSAPPSSSSSRSSCLAAPTSASSSMSVAAAASPCRWPRPWTWTPTRSRSKCSEAERLKGETHRVDSARDERCFPSDRCDSEHVKQPPRDANWNRPVSKQLCFWLLWICNTPEHKVTEKPNQMLFVCLLVK